MEDYNVVTEENKSTHKELMYVSKIHRFRRKLRGTVIVIVLILAGIVGALLYGNSLGKQKAEAEIDSLKNEIAAQNQQIKELIETPIVVSRVNPEIVLNIIHSELGNISELATMEYLFTNVSEFSDSKQIKNWNIPGTKKSFILKWDGVIKAGIKLDLVTIDVDDTEMKIVVSVPEAEILSYEVDNDSVEVLDEKDNIFNKLSIDDKVKFDASTAESMKQRAIENGLLEKAQANAENILRGLLLSDQDIINSYDIEFVITVQ